MRLAVLKAKRCKSATRTSDLAEDRTTPVRESLKDPICKRQSITKKLVTTYGCTIGKLQIRVLGMSEKVFKMTQGDPCGEHSQYGHKEVS